MDDTSQHRARFAQAFSSMVAWACGVEEAPPPVCARSATIFMDNVGAMVAGVADPTVAAACVRLTDGSNGNGSTIFAAGAPRAPARDAASVNGLAATWCELDEGYRGAPCHAGAYILPALLAEAEASHATVGEVLRALTLAYEITARTARAFPFPRMTVHPHAAWAMAGAAAGVAFLGRESPATVAGAFTAASTMTFVGPFNIAADGGLARNAWTAIGAQSGAHLVAWARMGIHGLGATPYDVFVGTLGAGFEIRALTDKLGQSWAVADGYHKIYACCQYAHSTVEASLELCGRDIPPERIEAIVVETHPSALLMPAVDPPNVLSAKFSIPHAAAAAAVMGTGGERAFSEAARTDAAIGALRHRVTMKPYQPLGAPPKDRPARVTWRLAGGETASAVCESAQGGADRPIPHDALRQKFAENVSQVFPAMLPIFDRLIAGDRDLLATPWRTVIDQMVGRRVS